MLTFENKFVRHCLTRRKYKNVGAVIVMNAVTNYPFFFFFFLNIPLLLLLLLLLGGGGFHWSDVILVPYGII
jgi:hypothetical protein